MNAEPIVICVFAVFVVTGCAMPEISREQMKSTANLYRSLETDLAVGKFYFPTNTLCENRIHILKWDEQLKVSQLLRRLERPTYMDIWVTFDKTLAQNDSALRIAQLTLEKQSDLKKKWRGCVLAALQDPNFECDTNAVLRALDNDGLVIHYFLVNRHNTPEMGRVDIVKFVITTVGGQIVARTKPQHSLDYPLYFVDQHNWENNYLF